MALVEMSTTKPTDGRRMAKALGSCLLLALFTWDLSLFVRILGA